MNETITFEEGDYGTRAIIRGEWQDSFFNELSEKGIQEIELNDGKGWRGKNVEFLKYFPELRSLVILHLSLDSIESVHFLKGLINLELTTYSGVPIDFTCFPKLENCWFEWIKGSESLFKCVTLRSLGVNRYEKKTSEAFRELVNLRELSIYNSRLENLDGVFSLEKLKFLDIARLRKLTSLKGIENFKNLEVLEIETCKGLSSVSEIFDLKKLKRLLLINLGEISSIKGLENLTELEEFLFYESTNIIDGDISPVISLKKLKSISFQNRKHYTHRREDFGNLYWTSTTS